MTVRRQSNSILGRKSLSVADGDEAAGGGGWLGSITSLLLRALLNVSLRVNNLVVKYLAPTSVASLTCQSIHLHTATDNWQAALSVSSFPLPITLSRSYYNIRMQPGIVSQSHTSLAHYHCFKSVGEHCGHSLLPGNRLTPPLQSTHSF